MVCEEDGGFHFLNKTWRRVDREEPGSWKTLQFYGVVDFPTGRIMLREYVTDLYNKNGTMVGSLDPKTGKLEIEAWHPECFWPMTMTRISTEPTPLPEDTFMPQYMLRPKKTSL